MEEFYFTIDANSTAEWKDRGSRFIGYAFPVSTIAECKKQMEEIKKKHPKASHHCFAYRIGADKLTFRVNDDGEPSGTAGKPILGQIDSRQLTNILVAVVRYFGGTLLGVPGLIQAYKTAAAECLNQTKIVQQNVEWDYTLEFDYTRMNEVMQLIKKLHITVQERSNGIYCNYRIGVPVMKLPLLQKELEEIPGTHLEKSL